jgi:glycosyltransferase involved in cell wall biosynthesis
MISVVIATHNRAASLRQTLATFESLRIPSGTRWELVIVNNASTDDTEGVCDEWKQRLPLRTVFIAQPGKSVALNAVLPKLESDLVLLTDDDVSVDPNWLAAIHAAAERNPECIFFGGKVISQWQAEPPKWFRENAHWLKSNPVVDWGEEPVFLTGVKSRPLIGANLAYRTRVFHEGLRYPEAEGMRGHEGDKGFRRGAEEFQPQTELLAAGARGMYVASASVFHRDPPERMTHRYVWLWYREMGRQNAASGERPDDPKRWFGAPRYLWGELLRHGATYLLRRFSGPSRAWLGAKVGVASAWGSIGEFRRQRAR